ncbi:hypothetical protein ScPMuIL_018678 [Solemya velum]
MVKDYSEDLRWRIIYHQHIHGSSAKTTSDALFVSLDCVYKIRRVYKQTGRVGKRPRPGPGRTLTRRQQHILKAMVNSKPECYLDEYQEWFREVTGKRLSISCMCQYILRLGFIRQKMNIIAYERQEHARAEQIQFTSQIFQGDVRFLDESSKDNRTSQRMYGRFRKGTRRRSTIGHFVRRHRVSVLVGIDINGVVGSRVVEGAFNTDTFNAAFEQEFLPSLGSFANREPRSIVVCDNCRIHNGFLAMVRAKGAIVHFLPPYSPDYMPVEEVFFVMKAWLRRNTDFNEQYPKIALYRALEEVTARHAEYFFQLCGY